MFLEREVRRLDAQAPSVIRIRTFLSSSTSSALRISHSRLSTTASLVSKLMRSSSRMLTDPNVRFHPSDVMDCPRLGSSARDDDAGVVGEATLPTGLRVGEVRL